MIRKLITIPDKRLRLKSKKISYFDDSIAQIASDMIETTLDWDHPSEFGAALAAIQIGEPIKLAIMRKDLKDPQKKEFIVLANPEIIKISPEKYQDIEGCLSVPGIYGKVQRSRQIKIKAKDLSGKQIRLNAKGFAARVIQHELDHMKGIIFLDHIKDSQDLFKIDQNGKLIPLKKPLKNRWKK